MELRDLGADNPFSMKDGIVFKTRDQFFLFGITTFLTQWHFHFKSSPKKYKVHRSLHPFIFFGVSVYLPYRYHETLNTVLFQLSRSSNPYINFLIRVPAKFLIYGASILAGQILARWYWVYKRSFNATKNATLNTYVFLKIYSNDGPYNEVAAFDDIRPKLVS